MNCGCTEPVQRTAKWLLPTGAPGQFVTDEKFTVPLVVTSTGEPANGLPLDVLAKYSPRRPVPLPAAAVLTNDALAIALLTAPLATAMACTTALLVKANGPV